MNDFQVRWHEIAKVIPYARNNLRVHQIARGEKAVPQIADNLTPAHVKAYRLMDNHTHIESMSRAAIGVAHIDCTSDADFGKNPDKVTSGRAVAPWTERTMKCTVDGNMRAINVGEFRFVGQLRRAVRVVRGIAGGSKTCQETPNSSLVNRVAPRRCSSPATRNVGFLV